MLLFLDAETYYDSKDYTLKKMSVVEYCRDPRFSFHGLGYSWESSINDPQWISGKDISKWISTVDWSVVEVVSHNIKFDLFALKTHFKFEPRSYIDTKGMSKAVLGKSIKSHHLAELATYFGLSNKGIMQTDGIRDLTSEQEKELAEYCKHDVWLCREIYKKLAPNFPENQYQYLSQTIEMFVNPKLQLNVEVLENAAKEENKRRENIFKEIGIDKKEFASNKKFPDLLARKGYEVPTKVSPRTGKTIPAIALGDIDFLEMKESENEELKSLCEARIAAKSTLLETRSKKLAVIGATGRWPFDVEFSGAEQTHRFSGGSGAGGNPQNFTRDSALREAVETPKGYKLIVGDFSNIEMRLVAYLSKDPGLIQAIEKGLDVYCEFASSFFGLKVTKKDVEKRRFGKTAILGLGYGMGWKKFINTVRIQTGQTITEEESRKAVDLYRKLYSKVPRLWEYLDSRIKDFIGEKNRPLGTLPIRQDKECLILPSGLRMRYPNLRQEPNEKGRMEWVYNIYQKGQLKQAKLYGGKLLENICQGLAGELLKESLSKIDGDVVGCVHDEALLLCRNGLELITKQKLYRAMTTSPSWLPELQLEAEVNYGSNWKNSKH